MQKVEQRTWQDMSFTPSSWSCWRTSSHAAGEVGRSRRPPSAMSRPLAPRRATTRSLPSGVPPPGSVRFTRAAGGLRLRLRALFRCPKPAPPPGRPPCCMCWAPGLWLRLCGRALRGGQRMLRFSSVSCVCAGRDPRCCRLPLQQCESGLVSRCVIACHDACTVI